MKDYTIGADPEFYITDLKGQPLHPMDYSTANNLPSKQVYNLGLDGCQRMFEVRPKQSKSPRVVVQNIRNIFEDCSNPDLRNNCKWIANPLNPNSKYSDEGIDFQGGHIHFGFGKKFFATRGTGAEESYLSFCTFLDFALAYPASLVYDSKALRERFNSDTYGSFSDFRINSHGMEYRTLPTWLSSPHMALSILSLAKVVGYEYLNFEERCNKFAMKMSGDYYNSMGEHELPRFDVIRNKVDKEIWPFIEKTYLFNSYKKEIGILKYMIDNELTFNQNLDIRDTWEIETKYVKFKDIWR